MSINFFDGALPKKVNLPAKRYPQFITAFEKQVEEAQARIRAMEAMERPYNIVTAALEEVSLPNDINVALYVAHVSINIQSVQTNALSDFDPLITSIGSALKKAGLHSDGVPSRLDGGCDTNFLRIWGSWTSKPATQVILTIKASEAGLRDVAFEKQERKSIDTVFKPVPRAGVPVGLPRLWAGRLLDDEGVLF